MDHHQAERMRRRAIAAETGETIRSGRAAVSARLAASDASVLDARRSGCTVAELAAAAGCSPTTIDRMTQRALAAEGLGRKAPKQSAGRPAALGRCPHPEAAVNLAVDGSGWCMDCGAKLGR